MKNRRRALIGSWMFAGAFTLTAGCGPASLDPDPGELDPTVNCPDFTSTTRLVDKPDVEPDYRIDCLAMVTGALTIEPGVVISFGPQGGLSVLGGSIKAVGTEAKPVVLRGVSTERGSWQGLTVMSADPGNTLAHVEVRHAGGAQAAVVVGNGARLAINDSLIEESKTHGLIVSDSANLTFKNNTITRNTQAPVKVGVRQVHVLDAASTFAGNDVDRVIVEGGTLSEGELTWRSLDVPYFVTGDAFIEGSTKLTIESGTTLRFETDKGLYVGGSASLKAEGTSGKPVQFLALDDTTGVWAGLRIDSGSPQNVLTFVEVARGGSAAWDSNGDRGGIILGYTGRLTLSDSIVRDSQHYGLNVLGEDATLSLARNTFRANENEPILLPASMSHVVDSASMFENHSRGFVRLFRATIDGVTGTWKKLKIPYLVTETLWLGDGTKLTIEAGAELRFVDDTGVGVWGTGALSATGTENEPVVFRGENAASAAWKGFQFESTSTANLLDHVSIEHAGSSAFDSNGHRGSILVFGKLTLKNSVIRASGTCAVKVLYEESVLTEENNTITGATNAICGVE